ncbi:MAG: hypothetical protein SH857_14355 [Chitinophagales bacterium]|nr:hypothetical protein [Chitinophagales bacterium]
MRRTGLFLVIALCFLKAGAQSAKSREHYANEVKVYTQKIAQNPGDIANYFARANFYQILCAFSSARSDFKKVVELYPANPKKYAKVTTDACYFLADDYFFRNADRVNAQHFLDKGLAITPGDKRFEVLQTGILGSYPEKEAEAEKKFELLLAKYPNDEKIAVYYAKFLERKDIKKSMELYEKVVLINSDNIDALFALGAYYTNEASRIYKANGDAGKVLDYTNKSAGYFESVHALNPDDKEIIEILIQLYGNLNRTADMKKIEQKL